MSLNEVNSILTLFRASIHLDHNVIRHRHRHRLETKIRRDRPSRSPEIHPRPPLGTLITNLPDATPNLQATYIPFIFDAPPATATNAELGTLRGHFALKNPHYTALADTCDPSTQTFDQEVMILFNSPIESYVTPSFYTHSKPLDGKLVPTWFFSAVQVYGTLSFPSSPSFLQSQVEDLTRHGEEHLMQFPAKQTWKISDSPKEFRDYKMKAIVGVEIKITRMEGKGKFGQEIKAGDQMGCIRGFEAMKTECGKDMAGQIEDSMRKDEGRVDVLEKEMGLVQGKKVKGKFGWYLTAAKGDGSMKDTKWPNVMVMVAIFILGLILALVKC